MSYRFRYSFGTYLNLLDSNQSQSGTPHGISHSERETSGNNLTLAGFTLGTYLPNGSPMENSTSANQTEINNALWHTNNRRTYDKQTCSSSSRRNNNTEIGRLWNRTASSGTPSGTHLDLVVRDRSQSGTPGGISHSERETSGNNLTLTGSPLGTYLLNGLPMLGDPPSKKLKVGRGEVRTPPPVSLPIIVSNYRAQNSDEQKRVARDLAACYFNIAPPDYHSRVQIYEIRDKRRKKEDAATLTNVNIRLEFERYSPPKNMEIFIDTLPRCLPLTIGFNMVDQKWAKIYCPCSKTMEGWPTASK